MGISNQDITKRTPQYMQNLGFDDTYLEPTLELLGEDSANGVLRRIQVDSTGAVKVSPTFTSVSMISPDGTVWTCTVTNNGVWDCEKPASGSGGSVWLGLGLSLMP